MFFFRESDVKKAVKAAKGAYRQKLYVRLPAKYNGPPFYEPLLIWPLMIDGSIYKIGKISTLIKYARGSSDLKFPRGHRSIPYISDRKT